MCFYSAPLGVLSIVTIVSVFLFICLSIRMHISETTRPGQNLRCSIGDNSRGRGLLSTTALLVDGEWLRGRAVGEGSVLCVPHRTRCQRRQRPADCAKQRHLSAGQPASPADHQQVPASETEWTHRPRVHH